MLENLWSPALDKLKVSVVRAPTRADFQTRWANQPYYFQLRQAWTTHSHDGVPLWDNNPNDEYSVPAWAREKYLFPPNDPRYCAEGGGDHNIFILCVDEQGNYIRTTDQYLAGMFAWHNGEGAGVWLRSDAQIEPLTKGDAPTFHVQDAKSSGWANVVLSSDGYNPDTGPGPWFACPYGMSDIVGGMGMPWRWHLSFWFVFQRVPRAVDGGGDGGNGGGDDDGGNDGGNDGGGGSQTGLKGMIDAAIARARAARQAIDDALAILEG